MPDYEWVHREMQKNGVTLSLLWVEYCEQCHQNGELPYANSNESSKQAQYAYYSAGNSKIKYKHDGTSTAAFWWLRSPRASTSTYFVYVNTDGTVN